MNEPKIEIGKWKRGEEIEINFEGKNIPVIPIEEEGALAVGFVHCTPEGDPRSMCKN